MGIDRNGKIQTPSEMNQYLEVSQIPGSVHYRGNVSYIIGEVAVTTFYFHVPFRSYRRLSIGGKVKSLDPLKRQYTIHMDREGAMELEKHNGEMEDDETKPRLKPVYSKKDRTQIIGWVMTFPKLHPDFLAKFKRSVPQKRRRTRTSTRGSIAKLQGRKSR